MRNWPIRVVAAVLLAIACPNSIVAQPRVSALDVARRFCQVDGLGLRLDPARWGVVAPLVDWPLEPAWDHVFTISGYKIETPRYFADHVEIPVEFTITATIAADESGGDLVPPQVVAATIRLASDGVGGWRVVGPPPVPHLFANQLDAEAMRASLQPDSTGYVSDSAFVWRMLTQAGWSMPYRSARELRDPALFVPTTEPRVNDVVLFLADDVPYHAGIVTADNLIASATTNRGVTQTTPDAFAGTVMYLHPREAPGATPTPLAEDELIPDERSPAPAPPPIATRTPVPIKKATQRPHPTNAGRKKPRRRATAKPRASHRTPTPRTTPTHATR